MLTSENTNEISAALAKAQGMITNPSKEAENSHFESQYADLSAGINAIRAALSSNGIAYVQTTRLDDNVLMLDTRISHSSGQWMQSEFPACRFPARPQEVGSALTYARRYSLFAMVGIAGEDDDGNEASKSETPARRVPTPPKPPKPPAAMMDQDASQVARDACIESISCAQSVSELVDWGAKNKPGIDRLFEADRQAVREAYADKLSELKSRQSEAA